MLIDDKLLLLGIRHHGPGSAASALQALTDFKPDCLLVEGAPEAEPLLAFMDDARLVPPVAQLIYAPDDARDSVFYPFTEFSPEWQAMRYARARGIAIRLMDLPQAHHLALARQDREAALSQAAESESESGSLPDGEVPIDTLSLSQDPLDMLASAAGFEDGERWWEFMVEQHPQQQDVFVAIADAMSALREQVEKEVGLSDREARREAWMRRTLREAQKSGYERIAVICGAWHVPALLRKVPVKDDNTLLKGLPKIKLQATWIPWTHGRISYRSGYGAGVTSPGWYAHLWQHTQAGTRSRITSGWLTKAARYLRDQHYDVPPASVIEAVRFADTLATLRQRPLPSLDEMNEAIQTLFCFGESAPLALLQKPLLIGEKLGKVPDNIPGVPLQEDLQSTQKRLRMKVSAVDTPLDLDLRNEIGLARSTLLHRLVLLGLPWGKCVSARGGKGTFKEQWVLQWQPEFELRLIELNLWGNTVSSACQHFVAQEIANTTELASVAHWIDRLLLADLPDTITQAIDRLQVLSAVSGDIEQLMRALPRLINITRYGDVRGTHSAALLHVVEGFCARIMIGLVHYSRHIDEAEAAAHTTQMQALSDALKLLACDDYLNDWWQCLQTLAAQEDTQPLIRGCCYRLLLNAAIISSDEAERALRLALSSAQAPLQAAQWIEGLLAGSGLLLVHDDRLWSVLNHYICSLDEARFLVLLPLLRRSFANFSTGERSQLLVKSRALTQIAATGSDQNFNYEGAIRALPLLYQMIGHSLPEIGSETALTGTGEGVQ